MQTWTGLLCLGLLVALVQARATAPEGRCYLPDQDFYPFMGTKTAYSYVRGFIGRPKATCEPKQVWMLARHGTRYPGEKIIKQFLNLSDIRDKIVENYNDKRGRLCATDLKNFENWSLDPKLKVENAEVLTEQGEKDLLTLAKRLKSALPELLKVKDQQSIEDSDYVFRSTDTQRTKASLKSFAEGLFGKQANVNAEKIPENDTLLLLYKNCPARYESYVTVERDEFLAGPEVQKLVADVNSRLGFTEKLNYSQIKAMYEMCRYETAWYLKNDSPWCVAFRKREMKIFEYLEDLDYYYCCASGREMNKKIGCQPLSNMFDHFKRVESAKVENQPKGVFLFAHSITMQTFFAAMNIGKDPTPILSNNYAESENRNYRSSLLGPFAANMVAVFYRCNNDPGSPNKVMFYVNENLESVSTTACKNGLCDWEMIKKEFGPLVDDCSTEFCFNFDKSTATTSSKKVEEKDKGSTGVSRNSTRPTQSGAEGTFRYSTIVLITVLTTVVRQSLGK